MKRIIMIVAAFSIAIVAKAMADEVKLDFYGTAGHGNSKTLVAELTTADYHGKVTLPQPIAASEAGIGDANPYQNQLVLAKDLLADLAPEARIDFVSTMHFCGNAISSEGHIILERSGLPETRVAIIASALQPATTPKAGTASASKSLDKLLEGMPTDVKKDFVDNLKFLNGNVVSAKTDLLEKAVSPEKSAAIMNVIMPLDTSKIINRLKDASCWTSVENGHVLHGCQDDPGYTCTLANCK